MKNGELIDELLDGSKKAVLFGAGQYGRMVQSWITSERVSFYIDNNSEKRGTTIDGIPVCSLAEKKDELENKVVILSVKNDEDLAKQLENNGITNYIRIRDLEETLIKDRMKKSRDNLDVYRRAIQWIEDHSIAGKGVINSTKHPLPYPEVSGYYIPSLLYWGKRDLAMTYAKWLCSIQKEDGSIWGTDDDAPYVFDTAQVTKGFLSIRDIMPEVKEHIIEACDWLVSRIDESGRMRAWDDTLWGDGSEYSELIHIYCLSPLVEAGETYGIPLYKEKAVKSLQYYLDNYLDQIMDFHLLSHFYAYIIEGLIDMGRSDLAEKAMEKVAQLQNASGAVPAYKGKKWVCSTGLFQFAVIWFRLGNINRGERAFKYACKLQNPTGGWNGGYLSMDDISENVNYFPLSEISWANKYFLDALRYRNEAIFNTQFDLFVDRVDPKSSIYQPVKEVIEELKKHSTEKMKIGDIGSGRGSYLKNLVIDFPDESYYAVDISERCMDTFSLAGVEKKKGCLTCIPYPDDFFDMTYACESLEHAIDIESAIAEMVRVTRSGGIVLVIDKYAEIMGDYVIEEWEQFFDEKWLKSILMKYCEGVKVIHGIGHRAGKTDMSAWYGQVMGGDSLR